MKLHITNSTTQHCVFAYREPTNNLLMSVEIPSGRQMVISGRNWSKEHIEKLIEQLEAFGAHDAAEAHRKIGNFHGILYRVDGIIDAEEIVSGHESVKEMQNNRSVEQAVNAALAADRAANPERGRRRTKRTEIEVEQLVPPDGRPTGDETHFALAVDAENGAGELVKSAA